MSNTKANGTQERVLAGIGCVLLFVAILAAYSNHFRNGFHFDDGHTIVNNAAIRDVRNIPLFFCDATTFSTLPSNQSYRPLVSTLIAIDYRLARGLDPLWFHVSIFALFNALALLLVFLIWHLLQRNSASPRNRWIAFVAAAFFALHPANADAINYVIVSAEVISALGVVASFAVYFAFPRHRRYFLYVLPAAVAILAKPTAAIFPILFALFRNCFPEKARRPSSFARIGETVLPFVICGSMLVFVQHMTPSTWVAGGINAKSYLVTQPYVALLYFKVFFLPTGLSADYDLTPFLTTGDPRLWIGVAFILFFILAAVAAAIFKKTRLIGFGLLWFFVALLPTALFPLAEVMNDYRAFLPYVGLVIALAPLAAWLVARLERQPTWRKIAAICAVALLLSASAYATFQRNKVWQNDETLWRDVVLRARAMGAA